MGRPQINNKSKYEPLTKLSIYILHFNEFYFTFFSRNKSELHTTMFLQKMLIFIFIFLN